MQTPPTPTTLSADPVADTCVERHELFVAPDGTAQVRRYRRTKAGMELHSDEALDGAECIAAFIALHPDPTSRPAATKLRRAWRKTLDERQRKEVSLARTYRTRYSHGTDGHHRLLLIAALADLLDNQEQALRAVRQRFAAEINLDEAGLSALIESALQAARARQE